MRHPLLLTGILLLMPAAAQAQVTIDLRALDALPQGSPPSRPPRSAPHVMLRTVLPEGPAPTAALPVPPIPPSEAAGGGPGSPAGATSTATAGPAPAAGPASPRQAVASAGSAPAPPTAPAPPAAPVAPAPPAATLPTAPPPLASLAPIPPPAAPATAAPPAPPPISAKAGTTAAPENSGLRLVFKPDESDLSPAANGAIGELVKATPSGSTVTFNVIAYAAGVTDDPSAARRTSLARGLSVRAALIADGIPSTRIYIRALGASTTEGPPDRVDMTVLGISGATAAAAPKP